MFNDEVKN
jgi:transposase InsO family protein